MYLEIQLLIIVFQSCLNSELLEPGLITHKYEKCCSYHLFICKQLFIKVEKILKFEIFVLANWRALLYFQSLL